MREPSAPRDQREIVVPSDMHARRAPSPTTPRPAVAGRSSPPPGELRASLLAVAGASARFCRRRPGEVAGSLLAIGAALVVSLNALGHQIGRHPAPILPRAESAAKPLPAKPAIIAAKDAAKDTGKDTTKDAAGAPAKTERASDATAPKPAARDAIADAIRATEDTTASVERKGDLAKADPAKADPQVTRAQRALAKLGYGALKADGMMGPGTKAAIERFERDRKIPVTGEAAGRTLRELAARAGLSG